MTEDRRVFKRHAGRAKNNVSYDDPSMIVRVRVEVRGCSPCLRLIIWHLKTVKCKWNLRWTMKKEERDVQRLTVKQSICAFLVNFSTRLMI